MGSKFIIIESSAGPYKQKKAALANDVTRRLLHISVDREDEEKLLILEEYISRLENSGYSKQQII